MTTPNANKTYAEQQAATLKGLKAQAQAYTPATLDQLVTPRDVVAAEIVFITPQVALDILAKHHAPNRALSTASKDAYQADMVRGRWELNGETIAFDTAGKLIQGQHRMGALSDAPKDLPGFPGLPFVAVFGLPRKVQETMDAGRKRSVADQLNIGQASGDRLGTKIVAALRALYLLGVAGSGGGKLGGGKLTNALLMDMFKRHKGIVKSVEYIHAKGDSELQIMVRPAVVAAIHYAANHLMGSTEEEKAALSAKADAFVEVLRTGVPTEGYEGQDPAHALYTRWNQPTFNNSKRPSENDALKYISLAWALYAEGKPATTKTYNKVVMVEPIGFTRTDVTGEALDLPVSSQPATEVTAAAKGAVKLPNGMTSKPGETEEQTVARYKAASEAADKATAAAKGKAKGKPTKAASKPASEAQTPAA